MKATLEISLISSYNVHAMNDVLHKKEPKKIRRIPRNVLALGWVSFWNDIASEMIYPIVPIFLRSVLGAPYAAIGLIEGVAESSSSIFRVFFGWLSDRAKKRKIFVALGYFLSAISKIMIGLAGAWPFVLFARFVDRFGKGTRTAARDSLILESVTPENQGRAFGFHRSMDSLGAVFGPLIALFLIEAYRDNYRQVFFIAALPAFLGILLLLVFVREKRKDRSAEKILSKNFPLGSSWKNFDPALKYFLLVSIVFAIGNSSDAFLILRAQNLGLDVAFTVLVYVLYNATYALFSYPAGIISDKIGPRRVLLWGFWIFALVYFFFGLIKSPIFIWILFPLYGIYIGLTDGISKAYIAKTIPDPCVSGNAYGAYYTATGFVSFFASLIAGFLWSYAGASAPFYFGATTASAAAIMFHFRKN